MVAINKKNSNNQGASSTMKHGKKDTDGKNNISKDFRETSKCFNRIICVILSIQPIHFIMFILIALIVTISCALFYEPRDDEVKLNSPFVHMIYFGSVYAYFGSQLWMTIISGCSLYFSFPRCSTIRKVEQTLFSIYFLINTILSSVSLLTLLLSNNLSFTVPLIIFQIGVLTCCCLIEVVISFHFTPFYTLTEMSGVEMEIGEYNDELFNPNEDYGYLYGCFIKNSTYIAMYNVITILCTIIHIKYLLQKIMLI